MTLRRLVVVAVAVLAALLGSGAAPAAAHPIPIQSTPDAGVVAPESPKSVSIAFSEDAVVSGSKLTITGPDGKNVPTGPLQAQAEGRVLSVTPRTKLASAVYVVHWVAFGDDGHVVSGSFRFGVAGPNGAAPPGAATLTGAGQRPGLDSARGDSPLRWISHWAGILSASLLLGGLLLLRRLQRKGEVPNDAAASSVLRFAPVVWLVTSLAAVGAVLTSATSGADGGFDTGLLTDSSTGLVDLLRLVLVLAASVALVALRRRPAVQAWAALAAAAVVLASYAFSGHVLTEPSPFYVAVIVVHVLAAGVWIGGLGAVVLASRTGAVPVATALRSYAVIAAGALALVAVTGVVAAIREVAHWYFLTWTGYGRVVIAKTILLVVVAGVGALAWRRSRAGERSPVRLAGAEVLSALVILALAVTLGSLVQGRERPLPAQVGTLFAGPAAATAVLEGGNVPVGLAPARTGPNVVTVGIPPESPTPTTVSVRLACESCHVAPRTVELSRHGGRTWSAPVVLAADGSWQAQVSLDSASSEPVSLEVGFPAAPGAHPLDVLAVADLSGASAERCRAHIIGVQLALARINAEGGLDGGRKVVLDVLDSGGSVAGAQAAAVRGLRDHPIASAGVCGEGGSAAIRKIAAAGVPVVVGDPAVDPTATPGVFRLAADPFAQGLAFGQLIRSRILASGTAAAPLVRAVVSDDVQGQRLLAGLQVGLLPQAAPHGLAASSRPTPKIALIGPGELASLGTAGLEGLIDAHHTTALVIDQPDAGGPDLAALEQLGRSRGDKVLTTPILLSERVLSETVIRAAGALGHLGAVQGVSEVSPASTDAELYRLAVPQLFRGELASLDGLRGYATGLALRSALQEGTTPAAIIKGLKSPGVFTSALLAPWSPRLPGAGSPSVVPVQPQFLPPTLVPGSQGGEGADDVYFPSGSWSVTSTVPLGLVPGLALPPVGAQHP